MRWTWIAIAAFMVACDGGSSSRSNSGFDFREDAFSFPNAGGNTTLALDADAAARMFGPEAVCVDGTFPCRALPLAQAWIDAVNETLESGRSEGMAVLAQLFHRGDRDPRDFGAETVAALELDGNPMLQAELAYWAATQHVPGAVTNRRLSAIEAVEFFRDELSADATDRYRLALAVRTEAGFESGHAIVPIALRDGTREGHHVLRVYDSNFPQRVRELELDTVANRWVYVVRVNDDVTLRYEGTEANGNALHVAPVSERLGQLTPPFAADASQGWLVHSGRLDVSVDAGAGALGIQDGALTEDGGTISPVFTACPLCGGSRGFLNYTMNGANADTPVEVTFSGGIGSDSANQTATLAVTRPNQTTRITGIAGRADQQDTVNVQPNGDVTYTNRSGTAMNLASTSTVDGVTSTIVVNIGGASTRVALLRNTDGTVSVDLRGIPAGTTVQISFGSDSPLATRPPLFQSLTTHTFVTDGTDTMATFEPVSAALTIGSQTIGGLCFNARLDSGEGGVDCGGNCDRRCSPGSGCQVDADCQAFVGTEFYQCNDNVCVSPTCADRRQNQSETDVDCGGPNCVACVADNADPPGCISNLHCDSNVCENGGCVEKKTIRVRAAGLPVGRTVTLLVTTDGVVTQRTVTAATNDPVVVPIGTARVYSAQVFVQPTGAACTFAASPPTSGTATDDVLLALNCGSTTADLAVSLRDFLDVPRFTIAQTIDGVGGTVTFDQTGIYTLGTFSSSWALEITAQPFAIFPSGRVDYSCLFERDELGNAIAPTSRITGTFQAGQTRHMPELNCILASRRPPDMGMADMGVADMGMADMGTADMGPNACTTDGQCTSNDCYCAENSGNCTGDTGRCGAGRAVIDTPTTDGVAASGMFTIPAGCSEVYIEAWGAAGGSSGEEDPFSFMYLMGQRGGSGGYVSGTLPVSESDTLTVWIGQGGAWNNDAAAGTAGVGSLAGVAANGGAAANNGDFNAYNAGGSGGGLTSVRQSGGATVTFSVPAGGGGGYGEIGQSVGEVGSGDGTGNAGGAGNDALGFGIGGGGAGDPGGLAGDETNVGGHAGTYGTLPATLTSANGAGDGSPANAGAYDRTLCTGIRSGDPAPGEASMTGPEGGDGCVVIRCVAP